MADETTLEQKRAEARAFRGVTYDDRIDRFTATIMIRGLRRHLGSYTTAREASLVYDQARRAEPIERRRAGSVSTIKKLMADFGDNAERVDGKVIPGQIFTASDQQRFRFEGVERKGKRNTFVWSSRCKICGALFDQNSVNSFRSITGMNRTCDAHRGQLGTAEVRDWPDPAEWGKEPLPSNTAAVATIAAPRTKAAEAKAETEMDIAMRLREGPTKVFVIDFLKTNPRLTVDVALKSYQYSQPKPSAREEDIEVLADQSTTSNEDLL